MSRKFLNSHDVDGIDVARDPGVHDITRNTLICEDEILNLALLPWH
jgi:hypothetical protein